MIKIKKSPTADTRTCDFSKISSKQLLQSSKSHIRDVEQAMDFFGRLIMDAGRIHDFTKILYKHDFYEDFKTGFKTQKWYKMHKMAERHHLQSPDGVRGNVDLVDVIECVVDCVMAGLARGGCLRPIEIPSEVLQKAVLNTANKLIKIIEVEDD